MCISIIKSAQAGLTWPPVRPATSSWAMSRPGRRCHFVSVLGENDRNALRDVFGVQISMYKLLVSIHYSPVSARYWFMVVLYSSM